MESNNIKLEIEHRKSIWNALSLFYLDTELQDAHYQAIVNTFLDSGFSVSVLKEIDLYEVFPVLKSNLVNVAGEWNGFDEGWLNENCKKAYFKRNRNFFKLKIRLYNKLFSGMRKKHWMEVEKRMEIRLKL